MRCAARLLVATAVVAAAAAPAHAQNRECAPYALFADASNICNAAVDGTRAFHPLAGLAVSGGNPLLSPAGGLGGFGHGALALRVNFLRVSVPSLEYAGESEVVPQEDEIVLPAPVVEAALGIFRGLDGGLLSVDLLGSAVFIPTDAIDDLTVDPDAPAIGDLAIGAGYGLRVGLLRGAWPVPSVSASIMRRSVPRVQYGDVSAGDQYAYSVDLTALNLRLVASTAVGPVALAAGVGRDRYTGDAVVDFELPLAAELAGVPARATLELAESRTLVFANAGVGFGLASLTGELGWQSGQDEPVATTFEGFDPERGTVFGGIGLRVAF